MKQPRKSRRNRWAFCERSGLKFPITELQVEPGTGLLVSRAYNDGIWNRVTTPQNDPLLPSATEFRQREKYYRDPDGVVTVGTMFVVEESSEVLPLVFDGVYLLLKEEFTA